MARKKGKPRQQRQRTLICCEGETEKEYFKMLKTKYRGTQVDIQIKTSKHTAALNMIQTLISAPENYERTYVVFDKDENSHSNLEKACKLAKDNNIKVLYSNDCFELYILLHFEEVRSHLNKKDLYKKLENWLGVNDYESSKGKKIEELFDRVHLAEKNCSNFSDDLTKSFNLNPYTNVGKYLKEIFYRDSL
ncbi:MAG TPA: RloB family protein [Kurthia gibsonii]|nr:RloB family protein [Kurthia gibsonii]